MFDTDKNITSLCIPFVKPAEHSSCLNVSVCFPPLVKFSVDITLQYGLKSGILLECAHYQKLNSRLNLHDSIKIKMFSKPDQTVKLLLSSVSQFL